MPETRKGEIKKFKDFHNHFQVEPLPLLSLYYFAMQLNSIRHSRRLYCHIRCLVITQRFLLREHLKNFLRVSQFWWLIQWNILWSWESTTLGLRLPKPWSLNLDKVSLLLWLIFFSLPCSFGNWASWYLRFERNEIIKKMAFIASKGGHR